jgi:NitT/TauT family transport system permease protein
MATATSSAESKTEVKAARTRKVQGGAWRDTVLVAGLRLAVIAVTLVLWQVMSGPVLPEYAVSKPTDVSHALWTVLGSSTGWTDIKTTAFEIVAGFGIGVAIGTVLGLVLGSVPLAGRVFEPLIAAVNGIPKIALAPLFLLFFGIGPMSKITIAAAGVAFVVFYNVYLGLRLRERELVEIVQVMGGRRHHVLSYVTLPTLAAPFFAALKTGGPLAILGVIGGEFIASTDGIGHELFTAATNLDAPTEFAGLIILVAMTLILNGILTGLDTLALKRLGLGDRRSRGKNS